MKKIGAIAAALLLIALTAPASAQPVISDPGICAQFYPNANCTNLGPNNPYTGDYQRRGGTSGPLVGNSWEDHNANWDHGKRRPRRSYDR